MAREEELESYTCGIEAPNALPFELLPSALASGSRCGAGGTVLPRRQTRGVLDVACFTRNRSSFYTTHDNVRLPSELAQGDFRGNSGQKCVAVARFLAEGCTNFASSVLPFWAARSALIIVGVTGAASLSRMSPGPPRQLRSSLIRAVALDPAAAVALLL